MGTYLSIPFASRKVLQVEPSPKAAVKRDELEVKDGEWVAGGKDPADVKPLTEEVIADLSRPLTPYEIQELNEKVNVPMSPIHEDQLEEKKEDQLEEKKEDQLEEKKEEEKKEEPKEEKKEEPKEEKKEEQKVASSLDKELMDSMELDHIMKNITINHNEYKEDIIEEPKVDVPRIPEFQPNTNSASHAIKKFNRRHRKH
jgi:DNA polymerase III alpha subunit (gram-positive type)